MGSSLGFGSHSLKLRLDQRTWAGHIKDIERVIGALAVSREIVARGAGADMGRNGVRKLLAV
jgi:hypothetical protein